MSKPYVVCYMMTSVDGRIDCSMTEKLRGVEEYYPLLEELNLKTAISGKVTAELELAEPGKFEAKEESVNKETFSKKVDSIKGYNVVVDNIGTLLWNDDSNYERPHLIITSEKVSKDYLKYLDSKNISYIVTGKEKIDLSKALEILNTEFKVERIGVVGGSAINTSFLDEGLLDEIIILIGAGIDGRSDYPTVFERKGGNGIPTPLELVEVKSYDTGSVLIRYKVK